MIELRWLVERNEIKSWDDRWDEERITTLHSPPKLQYRQTGIYGGGPIKWIDVPTIYEVVNR